jgi:hypothetical protein
MPSITTPSAMEIHGRNPTHAVGWNHAQTQPMISQMGKPAVNIPEILFKGYTDANLVEKSLKIGEKAMKIC